MSTKNFIFSKTFLKSEGMIKTFQTSKDEENMFLRNLPYEVFQAERKWYKNILNPQEDMKNIKMENM